jgi:hypothetical protein
MLWEPEGLTGRGLCLGRRRESDPWPRTCFMIVLGCVSGELLMPLRRNGRRWRGTLG